MSKSIYDCIEESSNYIKRSSNTTPLIGFVLGTGWQSFTEIIDQLCILDYKDIPHFQIPSVEGHEGKLIVGKCGNTYIICLNGRLHAYEGFSMEEIVHPIRTVCNLGISTLIVTNSAGGINPEFSQGDFMLIYDHINLTGENPLKGKCNPKIGPRFIDMTEPYDRELINVAEKGLKDLNITFNKGIYVGMNGPSYETPAEIKMLRLLGADVVGMSTIPEVIAARQMSVKVCGISYITNMAAGIKKEIISHDKLLAFTKKNKKILSTILKELITRFSLIKDFRQINGN